MCMCTHTYTHVCTHIYMRVYIYVCTCTYVYIYTCAWKSQLQSCEQLQPNLRHAATCCNTTTHCNTLQHTCTVLIGSCFSRTCRGEFVLQIYLTFLEASNRFGGVGGVRETNAQKARKVSGICWQFLKPKPSQSLGEGRRGGGGIEGGEKGGGGAGGGGEV